MKPEKGQKFYDKNGVLIQEGDLLKVFHFIGSRRKRNFMYKIAVVIDGYMYEKDYYSEHKCGLWSISDNYGVLSGTEIINKRDWENEDKMRKEGKLRMKKHLPF